MPVKDKVMVRVVEKFRPYSGDSVGYYLQVALPNEAGYRFGQPVPSFEKPWKLYKDSLVETQKDVDRILAWVERKHELIRM